MKRTILIQKRLGEDQKTKNEVIYLKRVKIGNLELPSDLELGSCKEINPEDIF